MGQIGQADNPLSEVTFRRSSRARRLTLRVSKLDGRVTLTVPRGVSEREAAGFVREKAGWIAKARSDVATEVIVDIGSEIPVFGKKRPVIKGVSRRAVIGEVIEAPENGAGSAIAAALKELARPVIVAAAERHAEALGATLGRVTLRDTRSRWGSCSTEGNLMLAWRLIMAPPEVLDYVVAHEAAHLREMNHSAAFWALVKELCPDFEDHKLWLRREGTALHRYRFEEC